MTHRLKNSSTSNNLEPATCEKFLTRHSKKEKKDTAKINLSKYRDNMSKHSSYNTCLLNGKFVQENLPLKARNSSGSLLESAVDVALLQPSIPTTSRQRSKSAADREPWGQLLKSERSSDRSAFGSFDPLRTLHFLVKELQFQLKSLLPNDNTILQIVTDMHNALKRIPPEVSSTIHLQQALDLLSVRSSKSSLDIPEKLKLTSDKSTQVTLQVEENEKLQKIMIENSLKLEASCQQMENICLKLKMEKEELEKQLSFEKENVIFYKKRILDLENATNLLTPKMINCEKEKEELKLELQRLKTSYETEQLLANSNLKSQITELKNSNALIEQESTKLKHQLKLSNLEKDKNSAILAVRNQQIQAMKDEILQLHDVINCKFLDFENNVKCLPKIKSHIKMLPNEIENNKENIEDCSLSTIYSDNHHIEKSFTQQPDRSYKELPSGDIDISTNYSLNFPSDLHRKNKEQSCFYRNLK